MPFEASVAEDCRRFAADYDGETSVSSSRLAYGDVGRVDSALREIDQCVTLYQELALGRSLGIQLQLRIPIECKHRDGLQLFGFEVGAATHRQHHPLVLAGDLAHSDRLDRVLLENQVNGLTQSVREIAALVDTSGKDRPKVLKEQFIYKASSALMDFVTFDIPEGSHGEDDRVLKSLGLLESFSDYTTSNRYSPMMVANKWLSSALDDNVDEFVDQYYGGRRVYHGLSVYLPVICVDGELFRASLALDGGVDEIDAVPLLLTGVRTPGWPQQVIGQAPRIGPEALIAVTGRGGLHELLVELHGWFVETTESLLALDEAEVGAVMLESAFMSAVRRRSQGSRTGVRSDLPLDWQL